MSKQEERTSTEILNTKPTDLIAFLDACSRETEERIANGTMQTVETKPVVHKRKQTKQCDNCGAILSVYRYKQGQGLCPVCIDMIQ